jgi:hypothetical protein
MRLFPPLQHSQAVLRKAKAKLKRGDDTLDSLRT